MNYEEARRILNLADADQLKDIKKKYHRLIGQYHPDVAGADSHEHTRRAQEINEAYRLVRLSVSETVEKQAPVWSARENPEASVERDVYVYYTLEHEGQKLYYTIARGKYMWEPLDEEFPLFLKSIRAAMLEKVQREKNTDIREQARLFYRLAQEFIDPGEALELLAEPESQKENGETIYRFCGYVRTEKKGAGQQPVPGDVVYPKGMDENRLIVQDRNKNVLGHVSFAEDWLYFCLYPLLKSHRAQVKMVVRKVTGSGGRRRTPGELVLDFYVRTGGE